MRFFGFLAVLAVMTLIILFVIGDRRSPKVETVEQEIELIEQPSAQP